jgi:hypothetical protein
MASNLLKTLEKIEKGRKKCINKSNEKNYQLPEDASLEQIANCIDAQQYADEYHQDYIAMISKDASKLVDGVLRMPPDVKKIGDYAFYQMTTIKDVILPEAPTSIGQYAFFECSGLTGPMNVPNTVTSIGKYAFYRTNNSEVNIPSSVKSLSTYALSDVRNVINYDARVSNIPEGCFYGVNVKPTKINMTDESIAAITRISRNGFYKVPLNKLPVTDNVTYIDYAAFNGCEINEPVVFSNAGLTTVGNNIFANSTFYKGFAFKDDNTKLTEYMFQSAVFYQDELIIPATTTTFSQYTLSQIKKGYIDTTTGTEKTGTLDRVVFLNEGVMSPSGYLMQSAQVKEVILHCNKITTSSTYLFNSSYIETVVFLNLESGSTIGSNCFNTTGLAKGGIYIPDNLVSEYKAATNWKTYASYIKPLSSWSGYADYMASLGGN